MFNNKSDDIVNENMIDRMVRYIYQNGNSFGEVVVIDDLYDSFSVAFLEGKFMLINFSPRENSIYDRREISPQEAFEYLRFLMTSQ